MNYIGVDIGGTKIAAGLVSGDGDLICQTRLPTLSQDGVEESLSQIQKAIEEILREAKSSRLGVNGIGICSAGYFDYEKGIIINPANLKGWNEVPLARIVSGRFGIETRLDNDANGLALAEMMWGAARGCKNVFFITLGTGIGTAIIIDGKLYRGRKGMAGEGGHMVVNFDDPEGKCGCGNVGCIEAFASGSAVARRSRKFVNTEQTILDELCGGDSGKLTMAMIGEAVARRDAVALKVLKEMGWILGVWLGSVINLLDPEIIIIGGGIATIGEPLFESIRPSALKHTINPYADKIPIVPACLGEGAGIYGGAALFLTNRT